MLLSNGETYPLKGHIAFVDRQINAQTGAIRIAATFPNPNNLLRPGQFARIQADTEIQHNALLIPQGGNPGAAGVCSRLMSLVRTTRHTWSH